YKKNGFFETSLDEIFGRYKLDDIIRVELNEINDKERQFLKLPKDVISGTAPGSATYYLFKLLALRDESFAAFLEKRQIDPTNPVSNISNQKSVFLKYKSEAVQRVVFRNRTRRLPHIHYGLYYIFDICDGNPRILAGLLNSFKKSLKISKSKKLTRAIQSNIIYEASSNFQNILKNHPESTVNMGGEAYNLSDNLLDSIGAFFLQKTVKDKFTKTMPTTFVVDGQVHDRILDLIETATYYGAIISLEPLEEYSKESILGKRFRLASLLCPKFKINNNSNHRVNLSTILRKSTMEGQKNLFTDV
ncbi:MAG: hypothetical protein JJ975_09810, partial [Bacteroidia bacterium]|nr:hypothetical protein [Bacteroidia bacterium]